MLSTLSDTQRKKLEKILRVNHAGEFGAVRICQGQLDALPDDRAIQHIAAQEQEHFDYFQKSLIENGVSPTLFKPLWSALGYGLGYIGGKSGSKAAHACTVAIEEVIIDHYSQQLKELETFPDTKEIQDIRRAIQTFLNEEAEHCHSAEVDGHGKEAPGYPVISRVIKGFSKFAIAVSKRL